MKVAIFGSCVSRDTAEFIPDAEVIAYVARHSVTSLETPHGTGGVDISGLDSAFQKRMVTSDLTGDGIASIVENAKDLDLVLIDLVDERRGYWIFPDGTTMTNSLEAEICGATKDALRAGARLVDFGTEEHFVKWKSGYEKLIEKLKDAELWHRTVLLDIEWACAIDGSPHPYRSTVGLLARRWRKLRRGARDAARVLSNGETVARAWKRLCSVKPTEAEEFRERAEKANLAYVRYRSLARSRMALSVTKSSSKVRIEPKHKWGPQPFHYREKDYKSIVARIFAILEERR